MDVTVERGPLALWRDLVAGGALAADAAQEDAAGRLDALWRALDGYAPVRSAAAGRTGLFGRFGRRGAAAAVRPRGVYLVGDVGRGK